MKMKFKIKKKKYDDQRRERCGQEQQSKSQ